MRLQLVNFSILDHARNLVRQGTSQPALHVLMRHRQASASDPRDEIFTSGGLITAGKNVSSKSKAGMWEARRKCIQGFCSRDIEGDRTLKIFSVPRVQENSSVGQLPSRVRDWGVSDEAASLQLWENGEGIEGVIRPGFAPTGSSKCTPLFNQDSTRLGRRGAIVCEGDALPLIIRTGRKDWQVVEDCYIHGYTDGQTYDLIKHTSMTMWLV